MNKKPSRIISEANLFLSEGENRKLLHEFLDKFSECEVYCRPVLLKYYKECGEDVTSEVVGLDASDIRDAFQDQGIYFADSQLVTRIFGASKKPGSSSCRFLRNKITHEMMIRAIREVCGERHTQLMDDMNAFITEVEEQSG